MSLRQHFPDFGSTSLCKIKDPLRQILKDSGCWPERPFTLGLSRGLNSLHFPLYLGRFDTGVWRDAQYSLILCKMRWHCVLVPIACAGFEINVTAATEYIYVKQLQGVKGCKKDLAETKWERLLLSAIIALARSLKYSEVRVQKSNFNRWKKSDTEWTKRLHLRYDVLPGRMGFRAHSEDLSSWSLRVA